MDQNPDRLNERLYGADAEGLPMDDTTNYERDVVGDPAATGNVYESDVYAETVFSTSPADEFRDPSGATDEAVGGDVDSSRAHIEDTRNEMSGTIDAIQQKLSPANLAQEAKTAVHDATIGTAQDMVSGATDAVSNAGSSVAGFGGTFVETVKSNPIPAALAGLGLGWLVYDTVKKSSKGSNSDRQWIAGYQTPANPYPTDAYTAHGGYPSTGGYANQRTYPDQTQSSQSPMSGAVDAAQGAAGQALDTVQDTAGQVASQAQQATSSTMQFMQSNPLAAGAAALAVGLAVGLSIPETSKEDELLGPKRDQLMDQAQNVVQEKAQQVQTVAQQAVGAAKDTAEKSAKDQGLTS